MKDLIDWALFLLVNGLAIKSSYAVSAVLNRSDRSFTLAVLSTGVIYIASVTATVLLLGTVFHQMDRTTLLSTSVGLSIVLMICFRRRRRPFYSELAYAWQVVVRERDPFIYLLVTLFLIQAAILIFKVALLPPHIWDVFYYQLTPAVEWFQRGEIPLQLDVAAQTMNQAPLGMTVLSYWFFIFFGDDFLVDLPQVLWAILLVPAAYQMGRLGGLSRGWAIKFAIAVFFIPFILMQAVTVKSHLGMAVAMLAALALFAHFIRFRDPRQIITALIALGCMFGYKRAAPEFGAVIIGLFFVFVWINRRDIAVSWRRIAGAGVLGLAIAALVSAYWYIRMALTGHTATVLPPSQGIGLDESKVASAAAGRFGIEALQNNIGVFFTRILDQGTVFSADLMNISGFGPLFMGFGLIGLIAGLALVWRRGEYRRPEYLIVLVGLVLFSAFLATNYSSNANSYRILAFLPVIMIVYGGITLSRLAVLQNRWSGLVTNLVISLGVVWALVVMSVPQQTNLMQLKAFVTAPDAYRTSGNYTHFFFKHPNLYHMLASMPSDAPVAIVSPPLFNRLFRKGQIETWSYPYYDRHWKRKLVYFKEPGTLNCDVRALVCQPDATLKAGLRAKGLHLVSTCPTNQCVRLLDPEFHELGPGFYYFIGQPS